VVRLRHLLELRWADAIQLAETRYDQALEREIQGHHQADDCVACLALREETGRFPEDVSPESFL